MSITIQQVERGASPRDFLRLAHLVHADDPFYIPAKASLPNDGACYVAYKDRRPVACCCARLQTGNPGMGTLGSFWAMNEPLAVRALLEAGVVALVQRGARRILGPMDGDTWHAYRLNTGPYDAPPFIKEPWNAPYAPALWEASGFKVVETYDSFVIDDPALAAANQQRYHRRCSKNGYTFLPITSKNFTGLLPTLHALSCRIFTDNIFYTALDLEAFKRMYRPVKALLQPGLSWMALGPDEAPAGYIFTFPDHADALRAMRGHTGPLANIRYLRNRHKATRTCIKTLGVVPERRGSGLTAALTYLSFQQSTALGYRQTLMCLMHHLNDSRRFGGKADRLFRSYALYEYAP